MTNTISKPRFEEVVAVTTMKVTTMNLPDFGLKFNAQCVSPMKFAGLRQADYGLGFRMPIMPELVPLVYTSLEHQDKETAKNVIKTLRERRLTGNTGVHYVPEGMYVQDDPDLVNGRVSMSQKALEGKLGSYEERGVVFSDDKSVRFVPYGFSRESQKSSLDLAGNSGVIALTGSEESAEMLAKASEHYKVNPYLWALSNVDSPETRVAILVSDRLDGRLGVIAYGSEHDNGWGSFGVLKNAEGVAEK